MSHSVVVLDEPHLPINHLHIVRHLDPVEVVCVCVVVRTYYVEPGVEVVHVPVSVRVIPTVITSVEIDSANGVLNRNLVEVVHSAELHEVVSRQQPVLVCPASVENGLSIDRVKRQRAGAREHAAQVIQLSEELPLLPLEYRSLHASSLPVDQGRQYLRPVTERLSTLEVAKPGLYFQCFRIR